MDKENLDTIVIPWSEVERLGIPPIDGLVEVETDDG